MIPGLVIVGGIVLVALIWLVANYNRFARLRQHILESWSDIDVEMKRRYELVPHLVETVKGYAAHEKETFDAVVAARTRAVDAGSVEEQGQAENMLTGALRKLFALAEDYPELRATENFQQLQAELADTEDKIAVSRQIYNDTTLTYNNSVQTIPTNIVAGLFGFDTRTYFEAEGDERTVPRAEF